MANKEKVKPLVLVDDTGLLCFRYDTGLRGKDEVVSIDVIEANSFAGEMVWGYVVVDINKEDGVWGYTNTHKFGSRMEEREVDNRVTTLMLTNNLPEEVAEAVLSKVTEIAQVGRNYMQSYDLEYGRGNVANAHTVKITAYRDFYERKFRKLQSNEVHGQMKLMSSMYPTYSGLYWKGAGDYSVGIIDVKHPIIEDGRKYPDYTNGVLEMDRDHGAFVIVTLAPSGKERTWYIGTHRQLNAWAEYMRALQRGGKTGFTELGVESMINSISNTLQ